MILRGVAALDCFAGRCSSWATAILALRACGETAGRVIAPGRTVLARVLCARRCGCKYQGERREEGLFQSLPFPQTGSLKANLEPKTGHDGGVEPA